MNLNFNESLFFNWVQTRILLQQWINFQTLEKDVSKSLRSICSLPSRTHVRTIGWLCSQNSYETPKKDHRHVDLLARIPSHHPSLSSIVRWSNCRGHPVTQQSCCIEVLAGLPTFARLCKVVHWSISFVSSSLLLQLYIMSGSSNLDSLRDGW